MPSSEPTSGERQPHAPPRSRRDRARTAAFVFLAVLVTLFGVLNVEEVKVDWILGSGHAPLIVVIVVTLLIGVVLTHFAERRTAKRR